MVVSIVSVRLLSATPRRISSSIVVTMCTRDRPSRSNEYSTKVSPSSASAMSAASPGRSARVPLILSVKSNSAGTLASVSARSCTSRFWEVVDTRA